MFILFFRKTRLVLASILLIICFFLGFSKSVLASSDIYFEDDFNGSSLSEDKWFFQNEGGNIVLDAGFLKLSAISSTRFPLVVNKIPIIPESGDYSVEVKFKYPTTTFWGTGIFLGNLKPDYSLTYSESIDSDLFHFVVWQSLNEHFYVHTRHCISDAICDGSRSTLYSSTESSSDHILQLTFSGDHFEVTLDGNPISDPSLLNSSRRPEYVSFGNFALTGTLTWTSLWIDYIKVSHPIADSDPVIKPVVIVPGLGGSWDLGAILGGTEGDDWEIPSFVKLYDNLIDSLVNAGYEKDANLFVFAYDWRKGLSDLAGDLADYLNGLVDQGKIETDEKVDIVGHSYGGLVARTYAQEVGTEKVDKIVTVGSPHRGIVDTYAVWEGATIWKNIWWQRAALELLTKLNQRPDENKVQTIRRLAPGIKDTLPIFDYLKSGDEILPVSNMAQKNAFLGDDVSAIDDFVWANGGTGRNTYRFLKVEDRNWLDRANGRWEDGKPISTSPFEMSSDGDDSVLTLSSFGPFTNRAELETDHGGIVSGLDPIKKIFEELGLDQSKVVIGESPDLRENVFVASLRSPGTLQVCNSLDVCNSDLGIYLPDDKVFFFPGYEDEPLTVRVIEDGSVGTYHLYLGDLADGEANWQTIDGNLQTEDQIDEYQFAVDDGISSVVADQTTTTRSLETDADNLSDLIPNWDKKNLLSKVRSTSESLNRRIIAARQLREILSSLAIKAHKNNQPDQIEAIINVWNDLDALLELILAGRNSVKGGHLNANMELVKGYKLVADNILKLSSSLDAAKFYEMFTERFDGAKLITSSQRDSALEKILSARLLLTTAVRIK